MKKIAAVLMCLCLIAVLPLTAYASQSNTNISAVVPNTHNITVVSDGAEVFFGGASNSSFTVERLSEPTFIIRANSGKTVKQVLLNGEDVTSSVKGGYYTLAPIYEDKTLMVVTQDSQSDTSQSKTYTVKGTVMQNGQPVEGVTLELRSTLKTDVTDKDGSFLFDSVECGKHSLTAIENGLIVGYVEFELAESEETSLSLADTGVYNITVDKDEIGIHLDLHLNEDNTMQIYSVSGIADSPKNDNSNKDNNDTKDDNNKNSSTTDKATVNNIIGNAKNSGTDGSAMLTGDNTSVGICVLILLALAAAAILTAAYGKKSEETDNR